MSEIYTRQLDIIKQDELNFPIHVIGAGGIGSWTALLLAKMGCPDIHLYDDDVVEEHNVASQFFKADQLNLPKVNSAHHNILEQTGIEIKTKNNIDEETITEGLIIITIDSMAERIRLANIYKDKNLYIIDGRMGGLQLEIYCCPTATYVATLVNPEDVSHEPCTARSICFNCAVIGGLITNFVRQYAKKNLINQELIFDFNNLSLLKSNL